MPLLPDRLDLICGGNAYTIVDHLYVVGSPMYTFIHILSKIDNS